MKEKIENTTKVIVTLPFFLVNKKLLG